MFRASTAALTLAASVLLHACAFAPGQHLDMDRLAREESPDSARFDMVPITPKLLAIQAADYASERIPAELLDYQPESYRIGAGDILHITVWDYPEMTAPSGPQQSLEANGRVVRPDGTLYYPYIGAVKAAGLTVEELRASIAKRLTKVIADPQVDVAVIKYESQKVVVSGAFENAEQQSVSSVPLSLLEVVGKAGVNTAQADLSSLMLTRDGKEYRLDLDALNRAGSSLGRVYVKHGDRIHLAFNDRKRVYVLGEVLKPAALPFKTSTLNLSDVLGTVGGLRQETADGSRVYVIRGAEDLSREPATVYHLDASSPTAFVLAERFHLQPQDVVYVGAADVTRWNRFISQVFPTANLLRAGTDIKTDLND